MTGVFAFIYLNEPFKNNMQKNTPLFQFIGWFVESGCWWYGFGVILIYCLLSAFYNRLSDGIIIVAFR